MQRRAVAVAAALFLVVGALSLGLVLTGEAPAFDAGADNVYQAGDEFTVDGQTYSVAAVEATEESGGGHGGGGGMSYEATIEWDTGNGTESATVSQHGNVTLSDQTFFAHFNSGEEVVISSNFETLREYNTETAQFEEHTNGLWGVSILTGLVGMLMIGMAYLPSRY